MAGLSSSPRRRRRRHHPETAITDLDEDVIAHCTTFLTVRDICSLSMTSTTLKRLAYSDSVWQRYLPERLVRQLPSSSRSSGIGTGTGARELYMAWRTDVQQFKFRDPFLLDFSGLRRIDNLLLHQNHIYFTQGSIVQMMNLDDYQMGAEDCFRVMNHHTDSITCMRVFSQGNRNFLVTSSRDHSIRMSWKGHCLRCFKGHNFPVSSLSNELLGDDSSSILASGGQDGTVRLWSLRSSSEEGEHNLKATLHRHEKPVKLMSVSGYNSSMLVTICRDSKVMVWDTASATSSAVGSSCCVGMTSVSGTPVNMKCHESLCYVATGSSVIAVDLRTMKYVVTAAVHRHEISSFDAVPSKYLLCTGDYNSALLWDIRRNQGLLKPEPLAELEGHNGPVTKLYMDPYKIVTCGRYDSHVKVWESGTGELTNSLPCFDGDRCVAMAVDGCRIATATRDALRCRDFNNATCPAMKLESD